MVRNIVYSWAKWALSLVCLCLLSASITNGMDDLEISEDGTYAYYTVKKGDTLWDLSQRFLNSHWKWPSLWEMNKDAPITNPHLIYPGQRIRLQLRESPPVSPPQASTPTEFSPPAKAVAPTVEKVDESLIGADIPFYNYSRINRVGFIKKARVAPSGKVLKVLGEKEMISTDDILYIRDMSRTPLELGAYYTIYRTGEPIKDEMTKELIGSQHYLTGVVEIIRKDIEIAMGKVIYAYRTIRVGDLLMPFQRRSPKIPLQKSVKGLTARIFLSEEHQNVMGDNTVAFINKGSYDEVKPGQQYAIYEQDIQEIDPVTRRKVNLPPVDYGSIIVLHVEENASTVLITNAIKQVYPGAKVRTKP